MRSRHDSLSARFSRATALFAVLCGALLCISSARASEPINQTDAAGDYDAALRILTQNGAGTGTVFDRFYDSDNNVLQMCIVTAEHVVHNSGLQAIGFRGTGQAGTFNITPDNYYYYRGGPTTTADYAFIGVTVDLDFYTAGQQALLLGITPETLAVAPATAGWRFTEHGYGLSGSGPEVQGVNNFLYVWHEEIAAEDYGTERTFDNWVENYVNYVSGPYNYVAAQWFLDDVTGAAPYDDPVAGEGQGNSGDSGAGLLTDDGLVGVLTTVWGDDARNLYNYNVAGNDREGFKIGSEGLGPRFDAADVAWLERACELYEQFEVVPEPSTCVLMGLGSLALAIAGWRRKSRLCLS